MGGTVQRFKEDPERWRIRVDAGTHPVTGKRRRLTAVVEAPWGRPGSPAPRLVEKTLAELQLDADLLRGDPTALDEITVAQLATRYLAHRKPDLRHSTWRSYSHHLELAVERIGNMEVAKVQPIHIDGLYAHLRETRAPSVVAKLHRVLRAMFSQAISWQIVGVNPVKGVRAPTVNESKSAPPEPAILTVALEKLRETDRDLATMARLASRTGNRRGELCALTWDRVDLRAGVIVVDRAVQEGDDGWIVGPTKTGAVNVLAIGPRAVKALAWHRKRLIDKARAVGVEPGPWVFPYDPTRPDVLPNPDSWSSRWGRRRGAVGLAGVQIHDLRHYTATETLGGGFSATDAAGRLSHSSPALVFSRYAHARPARDQAIALYLESIE